MQPEQLQEFTSYREKRIQRKNYDLRKKMSSCSKTVSFFKFRVCNLDGGRQTSALLQLDGSLKEQFKVGTAFEIYNVTVKRYEGQMVLVGGKNSQIIPVEQKSNTKTPKLMERVCEIPIAPRAHFQLWYFCKIL